MVKFRLERPEARLDVAETLPVGQLGEGHSEELVGAGERMHTMRPAVPRDAPLERAPRDHVHELREDRATGGHGPVLSAGWPSANLGPTLRAKSNRYQSLVAVTSEKYVSYRNGPGS